MSLTNHLGKKDDPIRLFLDAWLPNYSGLKEQWRKLEPIKIDPEYGRWGNLVGMALDYRIRFFFAEYDATSTVAARDRHINHELGVPFAALSRDLRLFCDLNSPKGRILAPPLEETLLRYSYVLAMYETNVRMGTFWYDSPLRTLRKGAGTRAQLNRVGEYDLADLKELTEAAYEAFRPMFGLPVHLNPKFKDSLLVDGADADLIVGRNLIEIKSDRDRFRSARIRQVLAYALLDSSGVFQLTECSIYLARWGKLLTWNLDELISQMSNGLQDYEGLRESFHEWLLELQERRVEDRIRRENERRRRERLDELMETVRKELRNVSEEHRLAKESGIRELIIETAGRLVQKMEEVQKHETEMRAMLRTSPSME